MSETPKATGENLKNMLRPLFDAQTDRLKGVFQEISVLNNSELAAAIERLETKFNVLETVFGEKKRGKSTAVKKPSAKETNVIEVKQKGVRGFYLNKMMWFKACYKLDENFADKYIQMIIDSGGEDLNELAKEIPEFASDAKSDKQKHVAKVNFVYKYVKDNHNDVLVEINKDYELASRQHQEKNEAKQEEPEAHSDDEEAEA